MPKKAASVNAQSRLQLSQEFYSDIFPEDMLYAGIIRSPYAQGTFVSLSCPQLPDGYAIFTGRDIPGTNQARTLGISVPIFCTGTIAYEGEPLGIITGSDENTVRELCTRVEVIADQTTPDGQPRKTSTLAERSIRTGLAETDEAAFEALFTAPLPPDGQAAQDKQDPAAESESAAKAAAKTEAEAAADTAGVKIISGTWSSALSEPIFSETNGALCSWSKDTLNVYTPTQWVSHLRTTLSEVLAVDSKSIRIHKTKSTNTGSNWIWRNTVFTAQAAVAALKTGRPVRLSLSRTEQERFMETPIPAIFSIRSRVRPDGRITAIDIAIDIDTGAFNPFASEILDRLVIAVCGAYAIPNVRIQAKAHGSHTPPSSLNMDLIDSQAFFAIENHMQKIADEMDILPGDLRKTNMLPADSCTSPFQLQLTHVAHAIDTTVQLSDFNRKFVTDRFDAQDRRDPRRSEQLPSPPRGIGMACAFTGSGYFGSNIYSIDQHLEITLEKDGTLTLHAMMPSAAVQSIWKKTAAELLELPEEKVRINSDFAAEEEPQLPEHVYSNLSIMMQLLKKCCSAIQRKRFSQPLPITVKKSVTQAQRRQWDKNNFRGIPFHSASFACAIIDLELDPGTYKENIKAIWVVVDGGRIMAVKAAENSIKMDINRILADLIKYETLDCPSINVRFVQSDEEPKQIHGLVQNVLPAAFTSALSQALANTVSDVPLMQETLFVKGMNYDYTAHS